MLISLIFLTIRPGVFDILFNCLKQQTNNNYELIIIDDYERKSGISREKEVRDYSKELGINLVHYGPTIKRTYPDSPFCYAAAMNSGILVSNGEIINILQDFCWINEHSFQNQIDFYKRNKKNKVTISFGEIYYKCPEKLINPEKLKYSNPDNKISIFDELMTKSPKEMGWEQCRPLTPAIDENVFKINEINKSAQGLFMESKFGECFYCSIPYDLLQELNGFDESLDFGDDCHEKNIFERSYRLGYKNYLNVDGYCQQLEHSQFQVGNTDFQRTAEDSNIPKLAEFRKNLQLGGGIRAPNNFDLKKREKKISVAVSSRNNIAKVYFIWDFDNNIGSIINQEDGLLKALHHLGLKSDIELRVSTQILGQQFRKVVYPHPLFDLYGFATTKDICDDVAEFKPDFVLIWGDTTRPCINELLNKESKGFKSGLLFAGGSTERKEVNKLFDVIFVESGSYFDAFSQQGINVVRAFGTNTELFKPKNLPKNYTFNMIADRANWKRYELLAEAAKLLKSKDIEKQNIQFITAGNIIPHEMQNYDCCVNAGITTFGRVQSTIANDIINSSKCTVLTAMNCGGSQRSLLESMACNIPVIAMKDSDKCSEYLIQAGYPDLIVEPNPEAIAKKVMEVLEGKYNDFNGRDFIMKNYSEYGYCNSIYNNIIKLLE